MNFQRESIVILLRQSFLFLDDDSRNIAICARFCAEIPPLRGIGGSTEYRFGDFNSKIEKVRNVGFRSLFTHWTHKLQNRCRPLRIGQHLDQVLDMRDFRQIFPMWGQVSDGAVGQPVCCAVRTPLPVDIDAGGLDPTPQRIFSPALLIVPDRFKNLVDLEKKPFVPEQDRLVEGIGGLLHPNCVKGAPIPIHPVIHKGAVNPAALRRTDPFARGKQTFKIAVLDRPDKRGRKPVSDLPSRPAFVGVEF